LAKLVITIDGPAASGKSTVARLLAERIGASFLDTGAMYRAVTVAAMQAGIDMADERKLLDVLEKGKFIFDIKSGLMTASVNGLDVTEEIRRPEVTENVHYVASAGKLREKLVEMQRQFAANHEKIVTEGRDQGTVAFADADIKFFLTASAAERARRRFAELQAKGGSTSLTTGEKVNLQQIGKDIEQRDKRDRDRVVGPLKPAPDAIVVDTTDFTIEQVVEKLLGYVKDAAERK
jgi:cytidylate kinase